MWQELAKVLLMTNKREFVETRETEPVDKSLIC